MCNGAWKARGAHELQNRTFEWRVGARVVSDGVEASTSVQIGVRRSQWYLHKRKRSNICSGDAKGSGLCSVKLLNDGDCRSRTQGRRLEDVGGSTTKGYSSCCDGGSDVKNGVTLIKTRVLRKGQSSGSDTMLEILNKCIVFLSKIIHMNVFIQEAYKCSKSKSVV